METTQPTTTPTRTANDVLDALLRFVNKRTGMDMRNYASSWADQDGVRAFRSEYREILRDGADARQLIAACRYLVPVEILLEQGDTGDRLTFKDGEFDYCVGQYWCTEYRTAACWYLRRCYRIALQKHGHDWQQIQARAKREFGRGIAKRWFS